MAKSHVLGATAPVIDKTHHYVTIELDTVSTPPQVRNAWTGATADWGSSVPTAMSYMASTLGEDGLAIDAGVDYDSVDVPGRNEPLLSYRSGGAVTFSLHLQFFAGIKTGGYNGDESGSGSGSGEQYDPVSVMEQCRWLDRLKRNFTISGIKYPPPAVIVRIGSLHIARCVLTGGNAVYGAKGAGLIPGTMYPMASEYEATFTIQLASYQYASAYNSLAGGIPKMNVFLYHLAPVS